MGFLGYVFGSRGSNWPTPKSLGIIRSWWWTFPLLGLLLLAGVALLIKVSAPQSFIDNTKVYFSFPRQLLQMGEYVGLPNDHMSMKHVQFFYEIFIFLGLQLMDDPLANLMASLFVPFVFIEFWRIAKGKWVSFFLLSCLWLSIPASWDVIGHVKNEVAVTWCLLALYRSQRDEPNWYRFGWLASLLFLLKPTAIVFVPFLGMHFSGWRRETLIFVWRSALGFLPLFLVWVGRNLLITGLPLYPYVGLWQPAPSAMDEHPLARPFQIEGALERLQWNLELIAGLQELHHFSPGLWLWLFVLGAVLALMGKGLFRGIWLVMGAMAFYVLFSSLFVFQTSSFRLSLPLLFCCSLPWVDAVAEGARGMRVWLVSAFLVACSVTYQESRILPGLRYHLGEDNLSEFYVKVDKPFGAIGAWPAVVDLEVEGPLLVFSEEPFLIRHPSALPISELSSVLDSGVKDDRGLLEEMESLGSSHLLIDVRVFPPLVQGEGYIYSWITRSEARGWLILEEKSPYHRLYRRSFSKEKEDAFRSNAPSKN